MVIQVIIRLTLYLDQALLRSQESRNGSVSGIDNTVSEKVFLENVYCFLALTTFYCLTFHLTVMVQSE